MDIALPNPRKINAGKKNFPLEVKTQVIKGVREEGLKTVHRIILYRIF